MYCNRCGKPMEPHYSGICKTCAYREALKNTTFEELMRRRTGNKSKSGQVKYKSSRGNGINPVLVVFLVLFPLFGIAYLFFKSLKYCTPTSGGASSLDVPTTSNTPSGGSASEPEQNHRSFGFTDGKGNLCESGGFFHDWSGNLIKWGDCFRDARGNLVEWGGAFYDNRGYYVGWGNAFYDAGDNYIVP